MTVIYITSNNIIDKKSYNELMKIYKNSDIVDNILLKDYNYKKRIEIEDKYADCVFSDFNTDLSFNPIKYNSRKEKEKNIELIEDYKRKLSEADYKAIKYAEGLISEADYAPIKAERENYRKAINSLEISLK